MKIGEMNRREFLKVTGTVIGASMVAGPDFTFAQGNPGAKVDPMKLMTATATMDPVRPEAARVIADAFKSFGWDVEADPIEYNQNIQKVIMQQDYDMWLVMLSGSAIRIDPDFYLYQCHHTAEYQKGHWNFMGFSNKEMDKVLEAQRTTMNPDARRKIVFQAQEPAYQGQAMNVLAYMQMTNAYRTDRVKNLTPMMGEGIGSFWADLSMEVIQGDGYVKTGRTIVLKNLNPVAANDTSEFMELRMIYDSLFRINPEGKAIPWMVSQYKFVDSKTIDLTLRDGLKWHDGKPLTTEDVKFSFDYQTKWKAPYFYTMLQLVEAVEITGRNTVRIKLTTPFAPLLTNLLGNLFIIPKHIWQEIPEKVGLDDPLKYTNETPVGSGPFKFDHYEPGRELKVSSFKQHFNPPKCAGIIAVNYGSHDAIAAAIEKGECDRTRYILKPSLLLDLKKVKNVEAKGYSNHGFYTLCYHTRRPPLTDPVFRRALAYVIPRDLICEAILSGLADPGGSVIGPANTFWHNPAVKAYPTDVNRAKKLLSDAGYTWDRQGKLFYPKKG
jgi:peptide/nickel transport system substrate-binding protein